jgi:phage terminase large subunit
MQIKISDCLPEAPDGTRSLLPKQQEFLEVALDPKKAKYIRYIGGIGSGKTIIGCVCVLTWAILYPGDYLIGRQYYPELRDTTLKTFLEICPKELILEYRVADAIVRIRSTGGKVSNIFFRHLEEPDKLRSLNLNGFYIDESSQVSEYAFLLLQGRLRGKAVRKGVLTTNSDGRSWSWRYFVQKSQFSTEEAKSLYYDIKAPSTENRHLPSDYVSTILATWTEDRIRREIYADEDAFEGAVYSEFRRDTHVIKPFKIPEEWTKFIGADHGYTNPSCWLWAAADYDGNIYVYREFYKSELTIKEICQEVNKLNADDKIDYVAIDPSIRATRAQTGASDWDTYQENLDKKFILTPARNEVMTGIDRVKMHLKVNDKTKKPKLFVFDSVIETLNEIGEYRWDRKEGQTDDKNAKEAPRKYKDHAMDALRYLVMSRPELPKEDDKLAKLRNESSLEGSLRRELHEIKNKSKRDPLIDDI